MQPTRRRVLSRSAAALAGMVLAGYASAGVHAQSSDIPVDDEMVRDLGESVTAFGLDLHAQLLEETPDENLLVSPYSASIALAMTWAGARGETADEMADALGLPFEQDRLHPTYGELEARVDPPADDDGDEEDADTADEEEAQEFELETANALWGQEGYPFSETFREVLETNYGAGMNEVDYAADPEAARAVINDWVAAQTEDEIEDLLPQGSITALTRFVLTNAVYFAANWERPFEEDVTEGAPFTALDGSTATVPMMSQTETFPYAEVDGTQVLSLPYVGGEADMVLVVPPEGEFEAVESALDSKTLQSYVDALEPTHGVVSLPRFSYESAFSLPETLQALGMEAAFDPDLANFDGMVASDSEVGQRLFIHDVLQKTFIGVDEEGTEAAAATAVIGGPTSDPTPAFELTVDRPFLYAIRHRETNTALFLGRVIRLEGEGEGESEEPDPIADEPPTDPDGDGRYQDITGDGEVGADDVVTFFENLENPAVTDTVEYYDFDESGTVGPSDVVALFESL